MMVPLVAQALRVLARERPDAHAAFRALLGDRSIALAFGDDDRATIRDGAVVDGVADPTVEVTTSARTLHGLLHGAVAPLDAVLDDRLFVRGDADDLIAVAAAMNVFLQGALRCAAMPALAGQLEREARGERNA
jgi:hypothetical protein